MYVCMNGCSFEIVCTYVYSKYLLSISFLHTSSKVGSRAARVKRRVPRRRKIRKSLVVAARIRKIREAVVAVIVKTRRRIVTAVFRSLRLVKLTSTLKKRKATLSSYNR